MDVEKLIKDTTTVVWLRRDLRLEDSTALYHAFQENENVLPLLFLTQPFWATLRILRTNGIRSFLKKRK